MSLSDVRVIPNLYDALASPPLSPQNLKPRTNPNSTRISPLALPIASNIPLISPRLGPVTSIVPVLPTDNTKIGGDDLDGDITINLDSKRLSFGTNPSIPRSLQPTQHPISVNDAVKHTGGLCIKIFNEPDSLTRERKGKMPVLSHLLCVGNGTVLSLVADKKYVYAGCQSADNEITVNCIHFLILKLYSRNVPGILKVKSSTIVSPTRSSRQCTRSTDHWGEKMACQFK